MAAEDAVEGGSLSIRSPRSALIRPAADADHHIFPKARREYFKNRYGIDVDDFLIKTDDLNHQALHAGQAPLKNKAGWWDYELMKRIADQEAFLNRKLTRDELIDLGNNMVRHFKLK